MAETDNNPEPNRKRWQFTLAQLLSLVTAVCLGCATVSTVVQWSATENLAWAIVARLLGVVAVGMLVGAMVADNRKALTGAVAGMIVADLLYAAIVARGWNNGLFPPSREYLLANPLLFLREYLLANPLLFLCVFPGAAAAVRSPLVGMVIGVVPLMVAVCTIVGVGVFTIVTNPPMNEGPGMIVGGVLMLLLPMMAISATGWVGGRIAILVTGRLKDRLTRGSRDS